MYRHAPVQCPLNTSLKEWIAIPLASHVVMPDSLINDLPYPPSVGVPAASRLPQNPDESLLLKATMRWRECHQGSRELVVATPGLRESINALLRQELDLDGELAGLRFTATEQQPEHFVSLTDACAFIVQHSTLEASIDERSQVTGVPAAHPLAVLKPLQLLERLKALSTEAALQARWLAFWDTRAPWTAVSCRERAIELYRDHFEAAAQVAFARRTLTAAQYKPLQEIIDTRTGTLMLDDQPIHTEQLALLLSNNSRVKLKGAWVITVGDVATASPLLYLPMRPVAIQVFKTRDDMQQWLTGQALVPTGLPDKDLRFEYTAVADPMISGSSDLFADRHQAQVTALRNATRGKPGLRAHGTKALAQADLFDSQRSSAIVVSLPPGPEPAQIDSDNDDRSLFGNLSASLPLSMRHAALEREREALDTLLEKDQDGALQQDCKDALKALEAAEQAAQTAATSLLYRARSLDLVTFNTAFTALYQAHKDGLRAEARLQTALAQLDSDEQRMLNAVLDTPLAAERDSRFTAASLSLSLSETTAETTAVQREMLKGPFVMARQTTLLDPDSPDSLLLYWPGSGGGLQRFANRRALAREVFRIAPDDGEQSLLLTSIDSDPLHHCLDQQISDFETRAAVIRSQTQHAQALEVLRISTFADVQVPVNAARSLNFEHVREEERSGKLATAAPDWLSKLSEADQGALKRLIQAFIPAMHRSHAQLALALESREEFTRKHLHKRLSDDFSIKGNFSVTLNLPDSVKTEKRYKPAPGHSGYELALVPSVGRSDMALEELAQLNIDNTPSMQLEPLALRLGFMQVDVTTADSTERQTLMDGITSTYLKRVVPELDLPKAYERRIYEAYTGSVEESAFVRDHHRECLLEPWRLILKMQGRLARIRQQISEDEWAILNVAIDANTPQAWLTNRQRVVIRPAYLSVGGKDTPNQGPTGLSGVNFIEEQISGTTLLYLPDSPDDRVLRRYDNLQAARQGLFTLCHTDKWGSYLAGRALQGTVRAHESRIAQAVLKGFDSVIGVGEPWPATTSLAGHLLNAHMGRLIEAHRNTSRSNDALYMERYALKGPRAFNYIKMVMGLLPFIGSAFALYDAWTAANQAVAAFLRGDVGDGLAEIESVLLSLIDAAMDLLPGEAAFHVLTRAARSLTRARHLRGLARSATALHRASERQARQLIARFAGYEYQQPLSLSGLQPDSSGLYQGIYRHADGDFIVRQGRIFAVERSVDSRNWRLRGTPEKTYKQPIALDETGEWDTWFGVYGRTFEGGGLGGGNTVGHLLDKLEPLWPEAVRQRLPRWFTNRNLRRHLLLTEACDDLADQLEARGLASDTLINQYHHTPEADKPGLLPRVEAACIGDIEIASRHVETLDRLMPLTSGNKKRRLLEIQSKSATLLADRYWRRAYHLSHSLDEVTSRIDAFVKSLDNLPPDNLGQRLQLLEDQRTLRIEYVHKLNELEQLKGSVNHWFSRIRIRTNRTRVRAMVDDVNTKHSETHLLFIRTTQRLEIVKRYSNTDEVSWLDLMEQSQTLRSDVARALYVQYTLPNITTTTAQRSEILSECLGVYTRFRLKMRIWTATYPQHFHLDVVDPLLDGIERLAERARKGIIGEPAQTVPGQPAQRVFRTADDQWLFGVERWEPTTQRQQYVMTGRGGYEEIWEQGSDGRFRLLNPPNVAPQPPAQLSLERLLTDARQRLDALPGYQARVQGYADQDMLPVELEEMMVSEADELSRRAARLENLAAQEPMIKQLRDKASEMRLGGREMRTRQSLVTRYPTDGILKDLLDHEVVEIRKVRPMRNLTKSKNNPDYMQEYEVLDLTLDPPELLWYAHFHYRRPTAAFSDFEKAHLKLPEYRYVTRAENPDLPPGEIGKNSSVLDYFMAIPNPD